MQYLSTMYLEGILGTHIPARRARSAFSRISLNVYTLPSIFGAVQCENGLVSLCCTSLHLGIKTTRAPGPSCF